MATRRAVWLLAEIDHKVGIDFHATILGVAIDHQHAAAIGADLWIELVVPSAEQRCGDV